MRCGVVFISQNHFQTVAGAFNLSWSFLDMSKMAIWFFYLINFFSCEHSRVVSACVLIEFFLKKASISLRDALRFATTSRAGSR